jgi:hypothetical protein
MKKIQCEPPLGNQSNDAYLNPNCIITQYPVSTETTVFIDQIALANEASEIVEPEFKGADAVNPVK